VESPDALTIAAMSPGGLAWYDLRSPDTGESLYEQPPHLQVLDREIMMMCNGWGEYADEDVRGIIFSVPPRHGKSFECSHYTPAWFLGRWPEKNVGVASYEADFSATWGRKAREVLESRGPEVFGVQVDQTTRAASHWRVKRMKRGRPIYGSMITAGLGGPLTGRGVHLLVVDDPIKNQVEAQSKKARQKVWDWYTSTASTRLEPGAKVIIIMTRWHDDDLAGRLLQNMKDETGRTFRYFNFPALAENDDPLGRAPGEPLWPQRYNKAALLAQKDDVGPYVWNALYQGHPAAQKGGIFDTDDFIRVDEPWGIPSRAVRAWDLAASEAEGDYTAGVLYERIGDKFLVRDVVRGQWDPTEQEKIIQRTAASDGRNVLIRFEQERGAAGKILVAHFKKLLNGYSVKGRIPTGEKEVRAVPASTAVGQGKVSVLNAPWTDDFLIECGQFPRGANDDMVDAFAAAHNWIAKPSGVAEW
jgi:predicted phage terminase large subunit-like protein